MMQKTVLITGGTGYIGSHVATELLQSNYKVVIVDNFNNSDNQALDNVEKISGKTVSFYQADVRDKAAMSAIFTQHRIDSVMHFAGHKAVGESVDEPIEYYDNNVAGLTATLSVMAKFNCFNLVFSSSATVYGNPETNPIKEDATLSATNPYGRSKLIIEQMLADLPKANKKWRIAILRYFNPIGAHPSGLLGENPNDTPNNLMPYISRVAAGFLPKLWVFGNDYDTKDGSGVRDYIHVLDIATGHISALDYLHTHQQNIIIVNLGTGRGYSVLEMIALFSQVSGIDVNYEITSRRAGDIATCYADVGLSENLLNWQAKHSIKQACIDLWHWQVLQT